MATTVTAHAKAVLARYPRPVTHMFRQLRDRRLGLVLGSGVNKPLGFPDWSTLVDRIAEHPSVNGTLLRRPADKTPLPILTQILLQHFRRQYERSAPPIARNERDLARLAAAAFRSVIHDCLYRDIPEDTAALLGRDAFYSHFEPVIRQSVLTVTYNFDDSLERILLHLRPSAERDRSRGFETVVDARLPFRLSQAIIYHPNGYLPHNPLEGGADPLVFSEDAFADQLIESMAGHFSSLLHHLSKNTCLLVGLSLEDSTLRHLLRQNAKLNAGHYHYLVHYYPAGTTLDPAELQARADANFEVFNLVTLFLDGNGIAGLGHLLSMDKPELRGVAEEVGVPVNFCHYLTGVPGVGKTTTAAYFKSLVTYDEWLDPRLPEMGQPHSTLSAAQREKVDQWVLTQVGLKNKRLIDDSLEPGIGLALVDRCIPDAIAFTPKEQWGAKARSLIGAVSPGKSNRIVHPGMVILLKGNPRELVVRAGCAGKTSEEAYVTGLQNDTAKVYDADGVAVVDVNEMSVTEVVKSVARIIHKETYTACDLQGILERVAANPPAVPVRPPDASGGPS